MIDLKDLKSQFDIDLARCGISREVDQIKVKYLGKKSVLKAEMKNLRSIEPSRKAEVAKELNSLNDYFSKRINEFAKKVLKKANQEKFEKERADVSYPGLINRTGGLHPVTQVEQKCFEFLRQLGFAIEEGPEVESPFYNFDALNIPEHHPARDLQDTFWVQGDLLLRSHTTTIQARVLEEGRELPIKVAAAGRVYRNEKVDATHLAMFHQLEGFWVDEGITFSHLKGVLTFVAKALYGNEQNFRFKPKFYPYTEPSIGLDIQCTKCLGEGCQTCHNAGWVTIMGAGMIHSNILKSFGYDKKGVRGIAFGWGTTRVTSQWLGLSNVRNMYDQDQRLFKNISRRGFK